MLSALNELGEADAAGRWRCYWQNLMVQIKLLEYWLQKKKKINIFKDLIGDNKLHFQCMHIVKSCALNLAFGLMTWADKGHLITLPLTTFTQPLALPGFLLWNSCHHYAAFVIRCPSLMTARVTTPHSGARSLRRTRTGTYVNLRRGPRRVIHKHR